MREGKSSRTAELVCAGRAIAHAQARVPAFADPTARTLASEETRAEIDRFLAGARGDWRARAFHLYLTRLSSIMIARTVAIDDAVRGAVGKQLVILGAGLDGRAWRMPELADVVVFEVDHPDTQREKRARIATLTRTAKEVRFVAVDFTRDSLDALLESAGHDRTRPTTWVWEGVVMYLTPEEVEATLHVIAERSAPRSRIAVLYHPPSITVRLMNFFVRRVGEPFRSRYRPEAMRALLAKHGFGELADEAMRDVAARIGGDFAREMRPVRHLRLAVADRA